MRRVLVRLAAAVVLGFVLASAAAAQPALTIKPLAEKKLDALPAGTLYWRIENLSSPPSDPAALGDSLAVEAAGRTWLFTLGAAGGSTPGATRVAEIGPIPRFEARSYLLRINDASGPPGSVTPIHSHPGSEAFYVLSGEQSIRSANGVLKLGMGGAEPGHGAGMAMQVSSTGKTGLHALVMFVVDADRPFSAPAALP